MKIFAKLSSNQGCFKAKSSDQGIFLSINHPDSSRDADGSTGLLQSVRQ